MPAASVTSVKRTVGIGTGGGPPFAAGPLLSTDAGASHTRTASLDQVRRPIYTSSVGRWKRDLSAADLATFGRLGDPRLIELGYEPA